MESDGSVTEGRTSTEPESVRADRATTVPEEREATRETWERDTLAQGLARAPRRKARFDTLSGLEIGDLYSPESIRHIDPLTDIGFPGEYPYTRGVHPTMYRARPWTIRQVAGFGTAEDTNRRYKYLVAAGQTGLSTDFDLPTLLGRDSDHPVARAEIGKIGVAIDTVVDADLLWQGLPLDEISTSLTINASAFILMAMYESVCRSRRVAPDLMLGTLQNDILKEYTAQNEYIYPPGPAVQLVVDTMEYAAHRMPRYNPVSVSGYHIREAGSTAVQELAFTLGAGLAYVEAAAERGLEVDAVAPQISFFFDIHNDFFEEIAKLRAARRLWARIMRERVGAGDRRSWMLRTHCQTAGVSLTAQQPENNIVRTTVQALAAVLGGTQSLHTNSKDEAYQIPSEEAIRTAVRTQQILLAENRVGDVVDPLAGSYFVEDLTSRLEEGADELLRQIRDRGGMVACVEDGFIQQQIADSSAAFQRSVEAGEEQIVGVNVFEHEEEGPGFGWFEIDPQTADRQIARLNRTRRERSDSAVREALRSVEQAARAGQNVMPHVSEAVEARASVGEICDVLRDVHGEYTPPLVY